MSYIQLTDIDAGYVKGKPILKDFNLEVEKGELLSLLGPSGCGKTTLLRMIAGFNSVDGGVIRFKEKVLNDIPAHKRNIGMVFQNYAIFPHMSVFNNVAYGLKARKASKEEIEKRVIEVLDLVQMTEYKDRQPSKLSGGQQQRIALARAIKDVKNNITQCKICHNLAESDLCDVCQDQGRDKSIICVVEQAKDVIMLEKTGMCKWLYHVLGGHIAPLDGIEPNDLTIDSLIKRVRNGKVKEVVMATNPTIDGDGTSLYISSLLKTENVKITRLARGLPSGTELEFANSNILAEAIIARQQME